MKILNLYANIGGNRKLWGDDHQITAVEINPKIADVYKDFWPDDNVVVGDAHKFLEDHYNEYDFIWASPPCPSHSRVRFANQIQNKPIFPDMKLYEEILFLKYYHKGRWCVENVVSFYEPLIPPTLFGSHYFWTNFWFPSNGFERSTRGISSKGETLETLASRGGVGLRKTKRERNRRSPCSTRHSRTRTRKAHT